MSMLDGIFGWMRQTLPHWSYFVLGPSVVFALTFGLSALLQPRMGRERGALAAGVLTLAAMVGGHRSAQGGSTGVALAVISAVTAVGWRIALDRHAPEQEG